VARERRLVDHHQVELARAMLRNSIDYLERQLGLGTLAPPTGRALIRRLTALRHQLSELEQVLTGLAPPADSPDRTDQD